MKLIRKLAIAALVALPVAEVVAQDMRLLSAWDRNYIAHPHIIEPFTRGITAGSNGRIKFTVSGPETVPPFEQLQPLSAGAFHFLITVGAYHFGTTPVLSVMDALNGDPEAIRASGILEVVDKQYNKLGVKVVGMPVTPEGGFHIILRQPIGPSGDLQGRKIRTTPTYHSVIKMLGGVPVVLPAAEIYSALDKGIVDGASWPVIGALGYRWNEVAGYLVRPAFGIVAHPILANLSTWNKLSAADRELVLHEVKKVEASYFKESGRVAQEEEKALIAKGMKITSMGEAQKAKLRAAWENGLWELATAKNPAAMEALRAYARSKKLAQ